jgi:hypothetical protein
LTLRIDGRSLPALLDVESARKRDDLSDSYDMRRNASNVDELSDGHRPSKNLKMENL